MVRRLPLGSGSVLDHLLRHGVPLSHECESSGACGTCLVEVRQGRENLRSPDEDEQDLLDRAGATRPGSRLACLAIPAGGDLEIDIPDFEPAPSARAFTGVPVPLVLSERAAAYLAGQLAKRGGRGLVRLGVRPAGCSGLRYEIGYADEARAHDAIFESGGIRFAVDTGSLSFIEGAAIDLVQEGISRRLRFENPHARQTCGCGESFAV